MKKKYKIILVILVLATSTFFAFIGYGFYLMEIEDHYGDQQELFYKSKNGDLMVNKDLKQVRTIEKTWKRVYSINNRDTVDLWHWMNDHKVAIYRIKQSSQELNSTSMDYENVQKLIESNKLELITEN